MKHRITGCLILLAGFTCGAFAQDAALAAMKPDAEQVAIQVAMQALAAGDAQAVDMAAKDMINNPAAQLYFQAGAARIRGNPDTAIELATRAVALHYQDVEWLPRNELLCAELYLELGMTNAAIATARQIQVLYKGTDISKKADGLRLNIEGVIPGTPE